MNTLPNLTVLDNQIRQIDNLYCLNDLHKASGALSKNKPANFIRLEQTKNLISEIVQSSNMGDGQGSDMSLALKVKHGGKNRGTYICKELVYSYAMWISAKFSLIVIRAFDALVSPKQPETLTKDQKGHIYQSVMRICAKSGLHYGKVFGELKRVFNVASYADIKQSDFVLACEHLGVEPLEGEYIPHQRPTPLPQLEDGRYLVCVENGDAEVRDVAGYNLVDAHHLRTVRNNIRILNRQLSVLDGNAGIGWLNAPLSV